MTGRRAQKRQSMFFDGNYEKKTCASDQSMLNMMVNYRERPSAHFHDKTTAFFDLFFKNLF